MSIEFLQNTLLGVGLAASVLVTLAILFWLPLVAMVALIFAAILYLYHFATGCRRSQVFHYANRALQASLMFGAISAIGHIILELLRSYAISLAHDLPSPVATAFLQ
ncbi:hypothetical protein EB231_26400 [Mesorhizobium sp. NZP2298]|nr:hypothetical protein EB231_26400 [Mesorhizobium sp. NZP2298]